MVRMARSSLFVLLSCVAAVFFFAALSGPVLAGGCVAGGTPIPSSNGNWTVVNATSCGNVTINITGNVTVNSGGSLTLENVTLLFNVSNAHNATLKIRDNGKLYANNTTVTTNATGGGIEVLFLKGSTVSMNNSIVRYVNGTTHRGTPIGTYLEGSNSTFEFRNVVFNNSHAGPAVTLNGTSSPTLVNLTLDDNKWGFNVTNSSSVTIYNSTISNTSDADITLATNSNVTFLGTTHNISKIPALTGSSSLNTSWYVEVYVVTSLANGNKYEMGIASVEVFSNNTTSVKNATTNASGLTSPTFILTHRINSSGGNYSNNQHNVTANKTGGGTLNNTLFNLSNSNLVGGSNVTVQMFWPLHILSFDSNVTSVEIPTQSYAFVNLTLNNTGNTWDRVIFKNNASEGWKFNFTSPNSSFSSTDYGLNISNYDNVSFTLRVEVPTNASPGTSYSINLSANSTGNSSRGRWNVSNLILTVNISNTTLNWANIVQNGTALLQKNMDTSLFVWNASNYTTAWALWAMNNTYSANTTSISQVLSRFNNSSNSSVAWLDSTYAAPNVTTALALIAHKKSSLSNTAYANLTASANYLSLIVNDTKTLPETAIILAAIYKSGVNTSDDTVNDAFNWLRDQQINGTAGRGSWGNDTINTSWALYAMASLGNTSDNRTAARRWLQSNQSMAGYFGNGNGLVNVTAVAILSLTEDNTNTTWFVDNDRNFSTTNDRFYHGSIERGLNYLARNSVSGSTGGWNTSTAGGDNLPTAMVIAAFSSGAKYGTLSGYVNGTGNASGWNNITAAIVSFNTSSANYSVATNNAGFFTLNLPVTKYTPLVHFDAYMTNSSVSEFTLNNSQNLTNKNFGALPKINVSGDNANPSNGIFNATTVDAGSRVKLNGSAIYAHSGQNFTGAMYYISDNSNSISSSNIATAASTNYTEHIFIAPSPSSLTAYSVTMWVNDTYGSNGSVTQTINVRAATSAVSAGGGGGGGGGAASDYALTIIEYDNQLTIAQGESRSTVVKIKNSGVQSLEDVALTVGGIPSSWYAVTVRNSTLSTEDLNSGEAVTFDVAWDIPSDAEAKTHVATWKATDKNSKALVEKSLELKISKVWTNTTVGDLNVTINQLKLRMANLTLLVSKLDRRGVDVTSLNADLKALNQSIQSSIQKYNAGEYSDSELLVIQAGLKADSIEKEINEELGQRGAVFRALKAVAIGGNLGSILAILIVSGFAGFIIWFKFFKMVRISHVKEEPSKFAEGTRIEGVVKSISETSKGKVFLVSDGTGKLHVRYPYYTTVVQGDMIRCTGLVKTYKDVPYMEASDLHKVTIKH
ncbi:TPA: hypothetical protein H1008_01105 [archaeon]|nr:hypothetical protein [Candidatus Undinarchaeales archaeon SRR5007147.bin71]